MKACCILIKAAEAEKFTIHRSKITSALGVSKVGVQMALRRLESKVKSQFY
jgi:hypothetical protein